MTARFLARLAITLLAGSVAVPAATASGVTKFVKKGKVVNRSEFADFGGKAHLRIPAGYSYIAGEDLAAFNKEAENLPDSEEVGLLVPVEGPWYVSFFIPVEDPLGGVPKEDVTAKADQILARLKDKAEAGNKDRLAAGLAPLRITGWTHKPAYDKVTNRITWGYRLTEDGEDGEDDTLNYETILFGPEGEVVQVMLIVDLKGYAKPLSQYRKLVDAVVFGSAPGVWHDLSAVFENERAVYTGAVVLAVVGGIGLMLRRTAPERRRAQPIPRPW